MGRPRARRGGGGPGAQATVPWYPVPFTGQTFGVLLAGGLLGWRRGAFAMALHLALAGSACP